MDENFWNFSILILRYVAYIWRGNRETSYEIVKQRIKIIKTFFFAYKSLETKCIHIVIYIYNKWNFNLEIFFCGMNDRE